MENERKLRVKLVRLREKLVEVKKNIEGKLKEKWGELKWKIGEIKREMRGKWATIERKLREILGENLELIISPQN